MEVREQMDKQLRELIEIIQFTEQVSAKVHGRLDEAEIYRIVEEEFAKSNKYTASIVLLTDDRSKLRVAQTSLSPRAVKALEGQTGLRLLRYTIDLNKPGVYSKVIREGETVQANVGNIVGELLPQPLAHIVVKRLGYEEKDCIVTPLSRHGQVVGALAMSSTSLAEYLIPSVRNLAQHISTALELADVNAKRRRAEETIRESEERYRSLFGRVPVGIYRTTPAGQILEANPSLVHMLGYPDRESLLAVNAYNLFVRPEERRRWRAVLEREGIVRDFEVQVRRRNGSAIWVRDTASVIRKAAGEVLWYEGILEDITARKQTEEAMRASMETMRAILDAIRDPAFLLDQEGIILAGNEAFAAILGKSLAELVGSCIYDNLSADEAKASKLRADAVMRSGKSSRGELERAGRYFDVVAYPVLDAQGHPERLAILAFDVTERKRAQTQLMQASKLASMAVLAGGVAHELRNPLGIISACAELLQQRSDDAKLRGQCTKRIQAATYRASQIIENLLRFAHPGDMLMTQVDIRRAFEETVDLLAHHMTLHKVKLRKRFERNLPKIHGSAELLRQVFTNLILNACNAMPSGGTLTATARATEADGVEMRFRDTGYGIAPEHLPNVFDPFFTTRSAGNGTGLGLSISRSIILQHHGTIEVQSQVGKGTTFTIRLPKTAETGQPVADGR